MHVPSIRFTILGVAVLALGCTDGIEQPAAPAVPDTPRLSIQASSQPEQQIARAFALALKGKPLRTALLQDLRTSPLTEHKLVLQDFVTTPSGEQLVAAAADAIGVTPATLASIIGALPPLDMYVPSRAQRRSWHARDGKVMVAAMLGDDFSTIVGYNPGGEQVSEPARLVDQGPVLLLLERAEAKGRRINAQSNVHGDVIQDEGDGEMSATLVTHGADGDSSVVDLATMPAGSQTLSTSSLCDPSTAITDCNDDPGSGQPGPQPPDTTFLTGLITREVCDNSMCGEGNEFEFRAHYKNSAGTTLYSQTLRIEGVPSTGTIIWNGGVTMIYKAAVGDGNYIDTDIVETDFFPNPDDNFDPNPVFRQLSDRDKIYDVGNFRSSCPVDFPRPCTALEVTFFWR